MSGPYSEEGYKLMGAAFEVYNEIGHGMAEEVYQECLEIELQLRGIPFETKRHLSLRYKKQQLDKTYIPDLFVFSVIVVELKSVKELVSDHEAQVFNYMRIARQSVGYLINFGHEDTLEWKRYVLSDFHGGND
ncbi:MAG: GxxExxY protein [Pirellulaceae bacterium]